MARPSPSPPNRRVIEALTLLECVEDFVEFVAFDADAGIGNPDFDFVRRWVQRFNHNAALRA